LWKNFKKMPTLLKFLTAHALSASILFIFSVVPVFSFGVEGKPVSYGEWWKSGFGFIASAAGILLPMSGYLFLKRSRYSRIVYISSVVFIYLCPLAMIVSGDHVIYFFMIISFVLIALISAYLYLSKSVNAYLAPKDCN
jgi:hypothetical protein